MTSIIVFVHLQMITTMMVVDILLSVLKKKRSSSTPGKRNFEYMLDEIQKRNAQLQQYDFSTIFSQSDSARS